MTRLDDVEMLALLAELEANAPEPEESHRLDVMYRHLGPTRQGVLDRVASLLRHSDAALAGARGSAEQQLIELEAGPCAILLELRPRVDSAAVDVHGQLFADDADPAGGTVVFTWGEEGMASAPLDEFGEFDLEDLPPGPWRASWHFEGTRIVRDQLGVGVPGEVG